MKPTAHLRLSPRGPTASLDRVPSGDEPGVAVLYRGRTATGRVVEAWVFQAGAYPHEDDVPGRTPHGNSPTKAVPVEGAGPAPDDADDSEGVLP